MAATTTLPTGPFPTLAPTWSPESSCAAVSAWNQVMFRNEKGKLQWDNVLGIPTVPAMSSYPLEGNCVPPSYTVMVPYVTDDGCPTGYTEACRSKSITATFGKGDTQAADYVTCCPSGPRIFTCALPTEEQANGCSYRGASGDVWTGSFWDYATTGAAVGARTISTLTEEEYMGAWGIKMLSTSPASSSSTSSASPSTTPAGLSNTSSMDGDSGLTTGAAVGIGIGVAAGILVLAGIILWLFFSKRRRQQREQQQMRDSPHDHMTEMDASTSSPTTTHLAFTPDKLAAVGDGRRPAYRDTGTDALPTPVEMGASSPPTELPGQSRVVPELP